MLTDLPSRADETAGVPARWRTDGAHSPSATGVTGWYAPVKAAADLALAALLLVPAAPVILFAALLVRLTSPGPVFYSQTRLGLGGRRFRIHKIRTMAHDCEKVSGVRWSTDGDPRVTGVGRFLRRTHLDELPQLWNVLRGEMSLVGPRPERPEIVATLEPAVPHYRERLRVRPGVTGLAQVQLPPDSDIPGVRRKVAYDLYYIGHAGPWLDLRLIACTAAHMAGIPYHTLCRLFFMPRRQLVEQAYLLRGGATPAPAPSPAPNSPYAPLALEPA